MIGVAGGSLNIIATGESKLYNVATTASAKVFWLMVRFICGVDVPPLFDMESHSPITEPAPLPVRDVKPETGVQTVPEV